MSSAGSPPPGVPDEALDRLYGLPLDAFVRERDGLARELRRSGDKEAADWVKGLPRPSVSAWAVNQVMRTQGRDARALLDAGAALSDAQERMLAGRGDAEELRAAAAAEREAVERLARAATGLLDSRGRGLSPALLERVRETLHAVALDPEGREEAAAGRLVQERRAVGFGGLGGAAVPAAPARRAPAPAPSRPGRKRGNGATREAPATDRRADVSREREAREAETRAAERRAREEALRAELRTARDEVRARRSALTDAERAARAARKEAAAAQQRAADAEAAVERAQAALEEAEARVARAREAKS